MTVNVLGSVNTGWAAGVRELGRAQAHSFLTWPRVGGHVGGAAGAPVASATSITASGPITSWQIDGETVETVADIICGFQNHCRW